MIKISLNTFKNHESIVVIGGGPSVSKNLNEVLQFSVEKKSIVIASNYIYPIPSHYTLITNNKIYRKQKKNIKNTLIVSSNVAKNNKLKKNTYILFSNEKITNINEISINENGSINHTLENCGCGCILLATFFKPKEILAVGFDGPKGNVQHHFDGKKTKFKENRVLKNRKFLTALVSYLKTKNVSLNIFDNDPFWGINKKSFDNIINIQNQA